MPIDVVKFLKNNGLDDWTKCNVATCILDAQVSMCAKLNLPCAVLLTAINSYLASKCTFVHACI